MDALGNRYWANGAVGPTSRGRFACVADRVFDGERTLAHHAVVVEGGRVTGVMPTASVPPEVPRLSEPDCTIIPGLVDIHTHFMRWMGPQFLAWGVTTIRDTGNPLQWILARRSEWRRRPWPRILCTGPLIDGPSPLHEVVSRPCRNLDDAVAAVRETAAAGVDGIKLYNRLAPEWLPAMVQESHAAGLKASMHCQRTGALVAVRAGVDEFHHLDGILVDVWPEHPPGWLELWGVPEFARRWAHLGELADTISRAEMATTPTLAYWDSQWRMRTPGHHESERLRHVPAPLVRRQSTGEPDARAVAQWRRALEAAQTFVGLLLERGARVLAGSDTPCGPVPPGMSLWRELALLVEAGMSPQEALRTATSHAASYLDQPDLGRLRPGAVADMAFVKGDPTIGIPDQPGIPMVLRGGTVHRGTELLDRPAPPLPELMQDPWAVQFQAHSTPN